MNNIVYMYYTRISRYFEILRMVGLVAMQIQSLNCRMLLSSFFKNCITLNRLWDFSCTYQQNIENLVCPGFEPVTSGLVQWIIEPRMSVSRPYVTHGNTRQKKRTKEHATFSLSTFFFFTVESQIFFTFSLLLIILKVS